MDKFSQINSSVSSHSNSLDQTSTPKAVATLYRLNSWMADTLGLIGHLKLGQLSLVSSHNAGMDHKAPYSSSYDTCQNNSFRFQLDRGVRVLDIRIEYYAGYGYPNEAMRFFHGSSSNRTLGEMHLAIHRFLQANPGEIIILDFHKVRAAHGKPVPYDQLRHNLLTTYENRLLPKSAVSLTLKQIKERYPGRQVILATGDLQGSSHEFFWGKLPHLWAGDGLVSAGRLKSYITEVMRNPPSSAVPWSLSATTYGVFGVGGISSELNDWYRAGSAWQMKSNIINVDWVEKSNLVIACIESNFTKAK